MAEGCGADPREVELKLRVPPEDVERLLRSPLVESLARGEPTTRTLHTVYYDAPDLRLTRAGVALRVRQSGGRFVQTVKSRGAGSAGLFERSEVECEVPGERPDLERIPDERLATRLQRELAGAVPGPVIETRFRRTSRRLIHQGTELLFELDQGEVHTVAGNAPICELELELVRGEAAALYDLALAIQASVPVRPVTISKADLGFARITDERASAHKARPPAPPDDPSLDALFAAVLAAGIDHLVANEDAARDGLDPEGVHQLRVAARRLRSALSLFAPVLPSDAVPTLRGELRWLASELGEARNLDVFLAETLEPLLRNGSGHADLKRLVGEARDLRDEVQERVRRALDSERFPRLVLTLGRWLVARGWRDGGSPEALAHLDAPARDATPALIGRWHRKVARRLQRIATLDVKQRHRLRLRAKKLRYAAEFLQWAHPGRRDQARRYAKHLARIQDDLGHQNDAATAERLLTSIVERLGNDPRPEDLLAAGFVAGCVHTRREIDERSLARNAAAFADQTPFWSDPDPESGADGSAG